MVISLLVSAVPETACVREFMLVATTRCFLEKNRRNTGSKTWNLDRGDKRRCWPQRTTSHSSLRGGVVTHQWRGGGEGNWATLVFRLQHGQPFSPKTKGDERTKHRFYSGNMFPLQFPPYLQIDEQILLFFPRIIKRQRKHDLLWVRTTGKVIVFFPEIRGNCKGQNVSGFKHVNWKPHQNVDARRLHVSTSCRYLPDLSKTAFIFLEIKAAQNPQKLLKQTCNRRLLQQPIWEEFFGINPITKEKSLKTRAHLAKSPARNRRGGFILTGNEKILPRQLKHICRWCEVCDRKSCISSG